MDVPVATWQLHFCGMSHRWEWAAKLNEKTTTQWVFIQKQSRLESILCHFFLASLMDLSSTNAFKITYKAENIPRKSPRRTSESYSAEPRSSVLDDTRVLHYKSKTGLRRIVQQNGTCIFTAVLAERTSENPTQSGEKFYYFFQWAAYCKSR